MVLRRAPTLPGFCPRAKRYGNPVAIATLSTDSTPASSHDQSCNRILSGIQPTGIPHLGNYCGAISHWAKFQKENKNGLKRSDLMFTIVDLHAITVPYDPKNMQSRVRDTLATLLAVGLDPLKCTMFKQSDILLHADLSWRLGCITPLKWLQRMTQYKCKTEQQQKDADFGLLAYPILMAADILLYRATLVPVGDDQQQHLELARMIATAFNHRFKCSLFDPPMPHLSEHEMCRIMSLRDASKKMSKSDPSAWARINLNDSEKMIQKKISKAQSDGISGITFNKLERPAISNLLSILSAVTESTIPSLVSQYENYQTSAFKKVVADAVISKISPIRRRIREYQKDSGYLDTVLENGASKASIIAAETMDRVRKVMCV
uniref:tryptophan--tRNA ligase n=1 Tax=Albugo laibachii Nc14 TaxID=890382 RepID=F0W8F9_9STRA|nr:unnamed protein product [Albugo laibachii Nc14]|eukprot:CCA17414.1 unnamed protein product [Albugo laibachii Nc14]